MIASLRHFLGWMVCAFRSREDLVFENLALRQQLLALHAQRPRSRLTALHKQFWGVENGLPICNRGVVLEQIYIVRHTVSVETSGGCKFCRSDSILQGMVQRKQAPIQF
jgi:hypothetical protein